MNLSRMSRLALVGLVLIVAPWAWHVRSTLAEFSALLAVAPQLRGPEADPKTATFLPDLIGKLPLLEEIKAAEVHFDPFAEVPKADPLSSLPRQFEPITGLGTIADEMVRAVQERLAKPSPRPAWPVEPAFDVPVVDYRKCLDTGRIWVALARYLAGHGQGKKALTLLAGTALLGYELEMSGKTRVSLLARNTGIRLRGLAGVGMMLTAPFAQVDSKEVRVIVRLLLALEQNSVTLADALETEKRSVAGFLQTVHTERIRGLLNAKGKPEPTSLVAFMVASQELQGRVNPSFDTLIKESRRPFPEGRKGLMAENDRIDRNIERLGTLSLETIRTLWAPSAVCGEQVFYVMLPNAFKARLGEVEMQAKLRAGLLCVAACCYGRERGKWPASLAELSRWLGVDVGKDPFSGNDFLFAAGTPPALRSVGSDGERGTPDDMEFMPQPGFRGK